MTPDQEEKFLQESLAFIRDLGVQNRLSQTCIATAQFYFHKVMEE